jgi:hypothetical protein
MLALTLLSDSAAMAALPARQNYSIHGNWLLMIWGIFILPM